MLVLISRIGYNEINVHTYTLSAFQTMLNSTIIFWSYLDEFSSV